MTSGESTYADANENFVAVCKQGGGGPIYVLNQNSPMKVPGNAPTINVHKGKCLDISFHPFHPTLIATAGEDTKTCVTSFPADGLTENVRISQAFPLFFSLGQRTALPTNPSLDLLSFAPLPCLSPCRTTTGVHSFVSPLSHTDNDSRRSSQRTSKEGGTM